MASPIRDPFNSGATPLSSQENDTSNGTTPSNNTPIPPRASVARNQAVFEATNRRYENMIRSALDSLANAIRGVMNPVARNNMERSAAEVDSLTRSMLAEIQSLQRRLINAEERIVTLERQNAEREENEANIAELDEAVERSEAFMENIRRHQNQRTYQKETPDWVPGASAHADWEAGGREGPEPAVDNSIWARIRGAWNMFVGIMRDGAPYLILGVQGLLSVANIVLTSIRLANM